MFPADFADELEQLADAWDLQQQNANDSDSDDSGSEGGGAQIPVWPSKMRSKISDKIAKAMHSDKQKKLPRWLNYIQSKHNPDMVISNDAEGHDVIFVRLDLIDDDEEAASAASDTNGTVVKGKDGHYYGFIAKI